MKTNVMSSETMTLFENCCNKRCREVTWQEVAALIGGDALRTKTETLRGMLSGIDELPEEDRRVREKEVKRLKATWFPGLMAACHCENGVRQLEKVTSYTGFCHVDFDHLTDEQLQAAVARLRALPEVLLMHTSMRGHGLHVYYRMDPMPTPDAGRSYQETYVQGFRQGNAYMASQAGVPFDAAMAPAVHLSCLCHDAAVYFNPDAVPFHIDLEHPVDGNLETIKPKKSRSRQKRGKGATGTKAEQIAAFLKTQPLRYDVIRRKIEVNDQSKLWSELTDRRLGDLYVDCNHSLGRNVTMTDLRAVLHSGVVPEVNPLREYVSGLPEWDGQTDYLGQVAAMVEVEEDRDRCKVEAGAAGGSDDSLWVRCFRKWFCAMVAGWMLDGVVNHQVLVLIGEQGIYKTSWLEALMPPELTAYRCKQTMARGLDKDEQLRATEFGLINMDEIDRMTENELNALKSLITATDVNVRSAYAQNKERRVRVASYVASGNKDRFLTDMTGNRRWLPFRVKSICSPFEHPLPYAGMYAQAWWLVQHGFDFWFSLDEIQQLSSHVEGFTVESNEAQLLPVYFTPCAPGTPGAVLLTVAEISAKLCTYGAIRKPLDVRQLGALLRSQGYVHQRAGRTQPRGYIVLEKSAESINAERRRQAMDGASESPSAPVAPIAPIPFNDLL